MHRHVERREAILEDARDVALLHIRQGREVAVGERQPVIVVANVKPLPEPLGEPFDDAELAPVGAPSDRGRLKLDTHRLAAFALDVVLDFRPIGQPRRHDERLIGRQELPIEEVFQRPFIDGEEFSAGNDADLVGDAPWLYTCDANHDPGRKRGTRPKGLPPDDKERQP